MSDSGLRLLALYPEQMNIYADRGNILFLRRRCEWRGIGFELSGAGLGDEVDPVDHVGDDLVGDFLIQARAVSTGAGASD